jgi:phosphoribosyl 1,2-cyclic phosphodiesterase
VFSGFRPQNLVVFSLKIFQRLREILEKWKKGLGVRRLTGMRELGEVGGEMIEFCVLGSGSAGNALVVRGGAAGVLLIDAGLSARELLVRLAAVGVDPVAVAGILVTHEHGDHVKGLVNFTKRHRVPVLGTAMTGAVLREGMSDGGLWRVVPSAGRFSFAGYEVETFPVPHDAVEPVGYVVGCGGVRLGVASDLGHATPQVLAGLRGVDGLFVEANYDMGMLERDTKRPWSTRQRIAGRHGHLSNEQTAGLLRESAGAGLQRVVLGHLSRDCNHPDLALAAVQGALAGRGEIPVSCAGQHEPTPWYAVGSPAAPPAWERGELF